MRWTVHGERFVYESPWVALSLVDVELSDGRRIDHHVVRMPRPAVGVVVHDPERGVLLLWRHRFITDTWGWEIPAGRVDEGETEEEAARRETLEETGWSVGELEPLVSFHPTNGLSDQRFTVFLGRGAVEVGEPSDPTEAERVEWLPLPEVRARLRTEVRDGLSLTGLSTAFALDLLG